MKSSHDMKIIHSIKYAYLRLDTYHNSV